MTGTHVAVAGRRPSITLAQRGELGRVLAALGLHHDGRLVLHHGCSPGVDEVAHHIVRKLGGWRIHGHPGPEAAKGSYESAQRTRRDLDVVHRSKPHPERDADIVNASHILVAVPDFPEDDPRSSQSETWMMIRMARAAGLEIIYVPRRRQARAEQAKGVREQRTATFVSGAKDVNWAGRQGRGWTARREQHAGDTSNSAAPTACRIRS